MADDDRRTLIEARLARLSVFPIAQVRALRDNLGRLPHAPWPSLEGCLTVLFTARSGSTYLINEIEREYDVGRVGESLNPAMVKAQAAATIVRRRAGKWFAFKAGVPGVVAAEISGFFGHYMAGTSFLRLVRRDIVAQAVSFAKAEQTERWHLEDAAANAAVYDRATIAKAVNTIARGAASLKLYAEQTGRPSAVVAYEDFADGDFDSVFSACDALGAPRREQPGEAPRRAVQRMGDAQNEEWRHRFEREMTPVTRGRIAEYLEMIAS